MLKTILTITIIVFSLLFSGVLANPIFATATNCVGGTTGKTLEGKSLPSEFSKEWQDCFGLEQAIKNSEEIGKLEVIKQMPLGIVANILGLALSFLGIIFFLIIIAAGVIWMTAMGTSEKSEKAKDMLEAAVIGLIIVLGAYAITKFVFKSFGAEKAPEFSVSIDCTQQANDQKACGAVGSAQKCHYNYKTCMTPCEAGGKIVSKTFSCKSVCADGETKLTTANLCPTSQFCCTP